MAESVTLKQSTPNLTTVSIGSFDFYFSYSTIVAFRTPKLGLVCCENIWTRTTGKHIYEIEPDALNRVKHEDFEQRLRTLLSKWEWAATVLAND